MLVTALASLGLTAVAATPAMAAGPAVTAPAVPAAGGTITVTGSGFAADGVGIYLGLGPAGLPGFYLGSGSLAPSETVWIATGLTEVASGSARQTPMNPDGSFSVSITVPAASASTPAYALYTSKAHGQGFSDTSQNTTTALTFAAPVATATTTTLSASPATVEEGGSVVLTAEVSPAASGTVAFTEGSSALGSTAVTDGKAALTTSALSVGDHSVTAAFTPDDAAAFDGSSSDAVAVKVTARVAPATASVSVSPATGLDPSGASLTVTGTAFKPTGGSVFGVYVGVGPKSVLNDPNWYLNAGYFANVKWVSTIGAGGSFTSTLTGVKAAITSNGQSVDCTAVECGIFTMAAHGSADRTQDTFTPISFASPSTGPVSTLLTLTTSAASTTPGAGVDVTVKVSPVAAGTVTIYDGVASSLPASLVVAAAAAAPTALASNLRLVNGSVTTHLDGFALGSRTLSASFTPDDPAAFAPAVAPSVTLNVTDVAVVDPGTVPVVTTPAANTPAQPVCVARSVDGATLDWGIKSSFRTYISGGIANGSWTLSGVTYGNGAYSWSNGSGTYNAVDDKGTIRFPGSVSFTGHGGVLNLVISNVALRVAGANSATIVADVHSTDMDGTPSDYAGVSFATVALSGGASGNTLTASGAPVTLTADGAKAFAGFYTAGTALDPVSFTVPLGSDVECDSTTASGLATTGGADAGGWPLLGGLLLLVGVAAVVAVRRRATAEVATPEVAGPAAL
ncbi:HtaA domain-containing protein [Leifsonia sp. NPDC058292]|uniref:HtaA domain-containing protein n=1 Tax=Leifsonia sp. NPDC058292 TaxID=3346428 RepID=UPI0036D93C48